MSETENIEFFARWKEKFLNEARTLAMFDKVPGIVHIRSFFEENQTAYIVMDFLEGISLKQYVKTNGKI